MIDSNFLGGIDPQCGNFRTQKQFISSVSRAGNTRFRSAKEYFRTIRNRAMGKQ